MRILLPLDGSSLAESALPMALSLAQRWQAELLLVRVVQLAPMAGAGSGIPTVAIDTMESELAYSGRYLQTQEARCQEMANSQGGVATKVAVRSLKLTGAPRNILPMVAKDEKCDLVVIASHGRSGIPRWLLGSVAEAVLRQVHCPTLLVRPGLPHPTTGFQRVMVPTDGSPSSRAVV